MSLSVHRSLARGISGRKHTMMINLVGNNKISVEEYIAELNREVSKDTTTLLINREDRWLDRQSELRSHRIS